MSNTLSPTSSTTRSRGNGKRLAQAALPDELNSWVGDFDRHLSQVVGLAAASRRQYRFFVRRFLAEYCPAIAHDQWVPRAEWLTTFVRQEAARLHGHSRKKPGTALRAWIRYLVFCGMAGRELEAAIPSMPQWKYASLPVRLTAEETECLQSSLPEYAGTVRADSRLVGRLENGPPSDDPRRRDEYPGRGTCAASHGGHADVTLPRFHVQQLMRRSIGQHRYPAEAEEGDDAVGGR